MSVSPALTDLSRLYQTEFVRSARAVGVLWAVCSLCFAIIQVVVLVQPSWVGTTAAGRQGAGLALPSGTLGLFEVRKAAVQTCALHTMPLQPPRHSSTYDTVTSCCEINW